MDFSEHSKQLTKHLSKEEKKKNGIYFTPPSIIAKMIKVLFPYFKNITNILEPSCGSCEFIQRFERFSRFKIDGIEFNETIYNSIKTKFKSTILNMDFLEWNSTKKYDLIIGNPPFYVMKKNEIKNKTYDEYYTGRPNIFILFIGKSLELLSEGGILAFVLPKNFMNCLYYDNLRKYISSNFKIIDIIDCYKDKYLETQQDTIGLIIQKQNCVLNNPRYTININNYTIFNTPSIISQIKECYNETTTLKNINFEVNVGNVVWNQVKDKLTNDENHTRLIYSSDILDNKLSIKKYNNEAKKNYITKPGKTDLLLVVNRGYGKGDYKFSYCLIDTDKPYLIENHLICIKYKGDITKQKLRKKYKTIINSLKSKKTKNFIKLYFGNNAINTTELCEIVPIYL
tara:strand:- start:1265 stop:2461 length:1197 start_codon:yes stop_codon:yes gene_type:complete